MAKNGLNAKAIAHAKWAVWGQKLKYVKNVRKTVSTSTLPLFYAKKRLEKTADVRKMRAF